MWELGRGLGGVVRECGVGLGVGECLAGVVGGAWGRRLGLNKKSINQLLQGFVFLF